MMTYLKPLVICASLLVSNSTLSQDNNSPFSISAKELLTKFNNTNDASYMARSSARCSALLLSVSGLLARDAPDTDLSGYETNYRNLYQIAAAADIQKAKERGSNKTTEDIAESVFAEIKAHADSYNRWMEKNYLTQGEYFGSSPSLRDELTFCRTIAEML